MSIERRIERVEEALGVGQDPVVCEIVVFAGRLPAEDRDGEGIRQNRTEGRGIHADAKAGEVPAGPARV